MKELIQGQKIRCDVHDAGSGQDVTFGKGLHIHKRMNRDRYSGAEIMIPIDSDSDVQIKAKGNDEEIKKRIINEIKKAFSDKQKVKQFAIALAEEIERYSIKDRFIENLRESAKRIARTLDLKEKIEIELTSSINNYIQNYYSIHNSNFDKHLYYIQQGKSFIDVGKYTGKKILHGKMNV